MTTPFPLSDFVMTISYFFYGFVRRDVDVVYVEKVCNCRNKNQHDTRMRFYLTFVFLGLKVVNKQTMIVFKGSEDFGFLNFIWLDRKYKPALSKSDSS